MEIEGCTQPITPSYKASRVRLYAKIFLLAALIGAIGFYLDHWFRAEIGIVKILSGYAADQWGLKSLLIGGFLYAVLLSLPFVPGVELGLLLMCIFGKQGVAMVYLATVIGLNLSFFIGRIMPQNRVIRRLEKIRVTKNGKPHASKIRCTLENVTLNKKIGLEGIYSFLSKHRYLAIGILYNIPGNYLIGGGGGISLACGLSGIILWRWFFLTVVIAVAPVPLLVWFGYIRLEAFLGVN